MSVETGNPQGQALSTADRSNAVAESLRQIARVSRFADRKKGIRSYQSHVRRDPWIPILFVLLFVLPTLAGLAWAWLIASDRYVTEARFAVRPAIGTVDKATDDKVGTNSGVPKQMIVQDTLIAADYIMSRPMIEAIERELPVRAMFSRDDIDWFSRFDPEKPIERLVKYWAERVKVHVESGSGIITIMVNAFDAQESYALSQAILKEAERMVNDLSVKSRDDAVAESRRELVLAQERMSKNRLAVRDLRNRNGVLDASKTNEMNLTVIGELRKTRIQLAVQLNLSLRDLSPETRRIQDMKAQIQDLDDNIDRIERQLANESPERRRVLADAMTQFEAFDNERKDSETYYGKILAANEKARIIASRQIEFFSPVVQPILPESAEQPRRWLLSSIIVAGAAVLFAFAVLIRKFVS